MKKIKLFPILATAITCATPMITLTSCSSTFDQLKQSVIYEFKQMCKIPHSSDKFLFDVPYKSNVLNMSNYLMNRVKKLTGQKVWQDQWGNIWFDVPYNDEKYKDTPTVGLQAHMDMVFSYDAKKYPEGQYPDAKTTAIDIVEETIDGKRTIHSKDFKTSIGADNGIGVAQILALISNNDIKHGNLRVIITNCEENAMQGAKMLIAGTANDLDKPEEKRYAGSNPHVLDGVKYMLNIDGETEGEIVVSCSGGVGSHYNKSYTPVNIETNWHKYRLDIDGFDGGHSGEAPHNLKGNAIMIANEILEEINGPYKEKLNEFIQLSSVSTPGTTVYNTVATHCIVEFASRNEISSEEFNRIKSKVNYNHKNSTDPWQKFVDMNPDKWTLSSADFNKALDKENSRLLLNLQKELGYGVIAWETDPELGKPENKISRNIGPCTMEISNDKLNFKMSTYSRSDDGKVVSEFKQSNMEDAANAGVDYSCDAEFPSWLGDSKSDLIKLTEKAMTEAGVKKITEAKIHGGVECSWWANAMQIISKIADAQTVSYGPRIDNCHQPTETLYIDTLEACLKTTLYILQNIK